jgi:lactoylglutathione lyase
MKFGYALLYVEDVEKTLAFYESAFGFARKFVHESGYGELDTGATTLGFVAHKLAESNGVAFTKADARGPAPAAEVAFVTDDVAAAYKKALAAGAAKVTPPKEKPWGQTVAYVRDLNGFLVELCTAVES